MKRSILYVITKASWGGAQRYVYALAVAARAAGLEVAVAYGESGLLVDKLEAAGVRTIAVGGLARDVGFAREFGAFFELVRLFGRERPSVVHINSSKAGALGALAARVAGVPKILFTSHGWAFNEARPWWQKLLIWKLAGLTVLLSHTTICVSKATARGIRRFPFARRKLVVIHLGIACAPGLSREAARTELAPPSIGSYWIGMISELHPTKRVEDAVGAMALLADQHPEALLVVIGEGEERGELEQLLHDLRLTKRVALAGFKSDAARLLPAFDLFLHASRSEGLGYAILEAGCASLPVVATRVGGIPEIIPSDDYGLLVPAKKPEALAAAIEIMMQDSTRARSAGALLHERVLTTFSRDRMLRDTLALYR